LLEAYNASDDLVVEIRAKRAIKSSEELYLDYELVVDDALAADYACLCGESALPRDHGGFARGF